MHVGKIEFDDYNPNSIKVKMNFAMNLSDLGHNRDYSMDDYDAFGRQEAFVTTTSTTTTTTTTTTTKKKKTKRNWKRKWNAYRRRYKLHGRKRRSLSDSGRLQPESLRVKGSQLILDNSKMETKKKKAMKQRFLYDNNG